MDRVLAWHPGSRGFDSHQGHMSEQFFWSNRPGYLHPASSELENSGIRVTVGDCSFTERRRWCPPYQTGKTVHVHAKYYKHNEDGRTAPGVCGNGSVPLSHLGNIFTRIGTHTHGFKIMLVWKSVAGQNYRSVIFLISSKWSESESELFTGDMSKDNHSPGIRPTGTLVRNVITLQIGPQIKIWRGNSRQIMETFSYFFHP